MPVRSDVRNLDPRDLDRNPENPRVIFRAEELKALEDSIRGQGILVPLTIYEDNQTHVILDGERRWRCSLKLGLQSVPAIIQPKPDRLQNIMMMFAIHNARKDWDPLPTAYKLADLEGEFTRTRGRRPTETELAELASLSRGEIRRLRKLLALPEEYREELMAELEKPRREQKLTVDHVIETQKGAAAIRKRGIVTPDEEDDLRRAIIAKFRSGIIQNTIAPRQLSRIARAVERGEVQAALAKRVIRRLIDDPKYTIEDAFEQSAESSDFQHSVEQVAGRLLTQIYEHQDRGYDLTDELRQRLEEVQRLIRRILKSA